MGTFLALTAALTYGLSHFWAGLAARRVLYVWVAAVGQLAGLIAVAVAVPFMGGIFLSIRGLGWGALSGIGTGLGVVFLYRGFAVGSMSVVSPLSEIAAVVLPVLVGFLLGERPSGLAWVGVAVALPAIVAVSQGGASHASSESQEPSGGSTSGAHWGLLAGAGFALQFIGLSQVPHDTGAWPLVAGRIASVVILGVWTASVSTHLPRFSRGSLTLALTAGAVGTTGSLLYMLATRQQLMALAAALASLYPIIPVLAGRFVLKEHIAYTQIAGLGCAAIAIALIAFG